MTELGVIITAATMTLLAAEFLRQRRGNFPAYGWLGIAALGTAELLMFRHVPPVAVYFTPIAWSAYILAADAAVFALRGRSRITDAPGRFAEMALLSIPLWMIFEAYNLHLANWTYTGLPRWWPAALAGYGWAFATITPGIFETADLIESLLPEKKGRPWKLPRAAENGMMAAGAACLLLPLLLPRPAAEYLFAPVWAGFALLLDPLNRRLRLPSFLGDFSEGRSRRFLSFVLAGWVCGWLWEFWNYWAEGKWRYIFPIEQDHKIFEMPAVGFLGFMPFALECFAMYVSTQWLLGRLRGAK